jgi:hypothetical protein
MVGSWFLINIATHREGYNDIIDKVGSELLSTPLPKSGGQS